MPSVPDPKSTFSGLFESHQGNFQVRPHCRQGIAQQACFVQLVSRQSVINNACSGSSLVAQWVKNAAQCS